ncbi:MAG: putative outer membrane protein [bacterium P3]|nr:MAG: putative outer membrane protein [bacterium P3]KWW41010.1 MAG: putative outer membrane protein [bacterium F083]
MIKKIFTFGLLLGLLAVNSTSIAQEQEYPHYGFWSNWSIGASVDLVKQGHHGSDWGKGISLGASLIVEKELNHVWDLRFAFQVPGFINKETDLVNAGMEDYFDRYASAVAGAKFSITDAIMGYDSLRRSSIYLLALGGVSYDRNDITRRLDGDFVFVAQAGLGYSYKFCKHSTFFVEGMVDDHASVRNIFDNRKMMDFFLNIGYLYNFGPTAADRARLAQISLLTKENFDALNSQVSDLQGKVDNKDKQIKKLEARVSELEKELANVIPQGNTAAADSLQRLIDQIKAEQMTFYALPFSILFDVDQYTVNESEMQKLAAVARVMKDNPGTKYNLYGFCDHTGSDKYNQSLSVKRVNEVKRLLVKRYGIAEDRLMTEGKGKSVWFGDVKYSINRRVSFYRVIE